MILTTKKPGAISLVALAVLFFLTSCRSSAPRETAPSAKQAVAEVDLRGPDALDDLVTSIPRIARQIADPAIFNAERCSATLDPISSFLYRQPSDFYYPTTEQDRAKAVAHAPELAKTLQSLRLDLRERFIGFANPSPECVSSVRKALRVARVAEETLALWMRESKLVAGVDTVFGGGFMRETLNPREADHRVRGGDVILMRGSSFISAIIARIGDDDAHFSHLAIVGEDDKGKLYLIESLIETGVGITPFEKWRTEHELSRAILFRHKNRELGRQAGRRIYDEVAKRLKDDGEIPYDFTMNVDDPSAIFCSEVVHWALRLAGSTATLPAHRTVISKLRGKKLLNDMGMTQPTTFSPSDLELDPSFDLIREHRGLEQLRKVQLQDAVASSVFHWKAELGYDLQNTWFERQLGRLAVTLRKTGLLTSYMQRHMTREMIADVVRYKAVADYLEGIALKAEKKHVKKHKRPMSYVDALTLLEQERRTDCRRHVLGSESILGPASRFHDYVGPRTPRECERTTALPGI